MQMRPKTPVTDLDMPDGNPSIENAQALNNATNDTNNNNNSNHNSSSSAGNGGGAGAMAMAMANGNIAGANTNSHMNGTVNNANMVRESGRKRSIPTVQNKTFYVEEEKHSMVGDPIYQTISSEKGAKLGRNCISLENLRTLTIKNDLHSYGNNLLQNQNGHPSSPYYLLPTFPPPPHGYQAPHYFAHKPHPFMYGPPTSFAMQPPPMMPPPSQQPSYFHNYRVPFTNYGGYANPNP